MFDPNDTEARLKAAATMDNFAKMLAEKGDPMVPEQKKVIDGFIYWLRNDRLMPNAIKS